MTTITRINANRRVYLENLLIWKLIRYLQLLINVDINKESIKEG